MEKPMLKDGKTDGRVEKPIANDGKAEQVSIRVSILLFLRKLPLLPPRLRRVGSTVQPSSTMGKAGLVLLCPACKGWTQPLSVAVPRVVPAWSKQKPRVWSNQGRSCLPLKQSWFELGQSRGPMLSHPGMNMPEDRSEPAQSLAPKESDPALNTPAAWTEMAPSPGPMLPPPAAMNTPDAQAKPAPACSKPLAKVGRSLFSAVSVQTARFGGCRRNVILRPAKLPFSTAMGTY